MTTATHPRPPAPSGSADTGPLDVCVYRREAYGLISPTSRVVFGGAEVRAYLFASELARRPAFRVSFMVGDEGQLRRQTVGNLTVVNEGIPLVVETVFDRAYKGYRRNGEPRATFPWFRVHRFRPGLLWQIPALVAHRLVFMPLNERARHRPFRPRPRPEYRLAGCRAFVCFGAGVGAADVVASGRRHGLASVVCVVHDQEVAVPHRPRDGFDTLMNAPGGAIWYALTHADRVVVQTERQAELLERNFGRAGTVIRNPVALGPAPAAGPREYVFWVGRAEAVTPPHKRPELLLEIARRCPAIPFVAVMNPTNLERFARLKAEKPGNLTLVEQVPYKEIDAWYARAAAFLNTSAAEGFPNTFLQAASHAVPIVSLAVDPDGMLSRHGGGVVCGDDPARAAAGLRRMWVDPTYASGIGRAARAYAEREHDISACGDALAGLLASAVAEHQPTGGRREPTHA
jgi:glycosyltransferase involved in cell wall biosynthesis